MVYTERHEGVLRIISARGATSTETRLLLQYLGENNE